MLKVEIPESKEKIIKTIKALESLLPTDDEKSKKYHMEAIEELKEALRKYNTICKKCEGVKSNDKESRRTNSNGIWSRRHTY